jgi:hypothetical protein
VGELHHWPATRPRFNELLNRAAFQVEYYNEDPDCVLFTAASRSFADTHRS